MLSQNTQRLDQLIILLLAKQPNATAQQLHRAASEMRTCTMQGVYHELRKLQSEGVVLKVRESYNLSLTWAFEFIQLADTIYDNYVASPSRSEIIPPENGARTWRFTNLLRLDDFWVQTMVVLFQHTKSEHLYNWIPHPWYYFAQRDKVEKFYTLFKKEGWQYHCTIGGETFLDRKYAEGMPKSFFEFRLGATPVFTDMSKYCTIIGDYMITVKLDAGTCARVEQLFSSITSTKGIRFEEVSPLLAAPGKLSFTVEHHPKKIGGYVRKYQRFFGL